MRRESVRFAAGLAAIVMIVAACGNDTGSGVTVSDPWARESTSVQDAGAAYFTVNAGAEGDTLLSVSVDSSVAAMAELHEVVEVEMSTTTMEGMGGETTMGGITGMAMQPVESVAIPANGSLEFKPGSYHVMLMGLTAPLEVGNTFDLTLHFEKAGDVTVTVEVREQ